MKEITVLSVGGEGCANCFSLLPVVRKLTEERGIPLRSVEIGSENAEEIQSLGITRIPTVAVMRGEEVVAQCSGYQPEEILEIWLDAKIREAKEKKYE